MVVGRSCSPAGSDNGIVRCSPIDPHSNGAISTVDNDMPREDFPGFPSQGGGVQSGELNEACSFFAFF